MSNRDKTKKKRHFSERQVNVTNSLKEQTLSFARWRARTSIEAAHRLQPYCMRSLLLVYGFPDPILLLDKGGRRILSIPTKIPEELISELIHYCPDSLEVNGKLYRKAQ